MHKFQYFYKIFALMILDFT